MTDAELIRRLMLSRRTLAGYRSFPGVLAGPVEDLLAIIGTEIGLLRGWAAEFPDRARAIDRLAGDWEALRDRVKMKAH